MPAKESKNIAKGARRRNRPYALADAVPLLQKVKFAKFDETVDLTLRLELTFATPTRWSAARWFCRTAWARPSGLP